MMQIIETIYDSQFLRFLVDISIKSSIVFLLGSIFAFFLRRKSAAIRSFVWSMTIIGFLTIPLFSAIFPKWEIRVLPQTLAGNNTDVSAEAAQPLATHITVDLNQTSTESATPVGITPIQNQPEMVDGTNNIFQTFRWTTWIGIVWWCVSGFFLARLLIGVGAIWYYSIRADDFDASIYQLPSTLNHQIRLRLTNRITIPMVWGFIRPVILLPIDAVTWDSERLQAIILHETAHIKRWDWLMQTIARITCAFYWFNPFVWFASHRMRMEAEQACDDQVLNSGYQSTAYAQHLLAIVRNVKSVSAFSQGAVTMASTSKIEGRLKTILSDNLNRYPMKKVTVGFGMLILICSAITISVMRLTEADNSEEPIYQALQGNSGVQSTPELFPPRPAVEEGDTNQIQKQQNIEICKHNLETIGKAIQAYQKENGRFPSWLSDLYPKYIDDPNTLLCPSDKIGGKPIYYTNTDPKMPVSYGYQFHPELRFTTLENQKIYGDVIPLARCRHHTDQPFECINLGFSFKIYTSPGMWQKTPEDMYDSIEETIAALEAGIQKLPEYGAFNYIYLTLLRLYIEVGRENDAEELISRYESTVNPADIDDHLFLSQMLETANQHQKRLQLFQKLEKRYPKSYIVLDKLAEIHQELGNTELANEYRKKTDPMADMVGKIVPDFSTKDLNGKAISLHQYKGKVVLLYFWAVWSRPCIAEMPNMKRIFNTYHDKGLEIIGVSLDTDETRLRNYLNANDIQWHQIYNGEKWNSPLVKKYHIDGIPTAWLIAKDGTLISRNARGKKLEEHIVKLLKQKNENQ